MIAKTGNPPNSASAQGGSAFRMHLYQTTWFLNYPISDKYSKTSGKGSKKMSMLYHLKSLQLETYHLKLPANRL